MALEQPNINFHGTPMDYEQIKQKQADFNRYMQDMEGMIQRMDLMVHNVRIETDEETEKTKLVRLGPPLANEMGCEFIKSAFRMVLNPNTYFSEPERNDIQSIYLSNINSFQDDLLLSMEKFNMDEEAVSKVYHLYCQVLLFALLKARGDKGAIYGSMSSSNTPAPQGGSLLDLLRPRPQAPV